MIFIAGAFVVSLLNVLVALALSLHLNVGEYADISMMCEVLGESDNACRDGAVSSGYAMGLGLVVSLALAFAFNGKIARRVDKPVDEHFAFGWCLVATVLLFSVHIAMDTFTAKSLSRIGEITRFSSLISLENLLWPLLLHMMNTARTARFKIMYLSLLLPVVALSPYRGVLMAVVVFGVGLPIVAYATSLKLHWKSVLGQRRLMAGLALGMVTVVLLLSTMYIDTRNRSTNIDVGQTRSDAATKLTQRIAYPLFQAHFAEKIAHQEPVPTVFDEILRKFRLVGGQNLNEMLYAKVYGEGTVGEMTSLYYGEAVANTMSHPIIWIVVAPLLLVAIWLGLGRFGYDVGTLVGIGIWRGSLGGVASVLPALLIQILLCAALVRRAKKG